LDALVGNVNLYGYYGKQYEVSLKTRTIIWSSNPSIKYIAKGNVVVFFNRYLYSHVYCNTIHNDQKIGNNLRVH
jgi:hypothetical protein